MPKGTPYSGEFKQTLIETNLSFKETMKGFRIRGHHTVHD